MDPRILKSLLCGGLYVVDEEAVAEAIVARILARQTVPGVTFRNDQQRRTEVRSFHLCPGARSFRPSGPARRGATHR